MKRLINIILFFSIITSAFLQNFDLIVTTKGDLIACRIDSITDTHIYLK